MSRTPQPNYAEWYPEMIQLLQQAWRPGLPSAELLAVTRRLERALVRSLLADGLLPALVWSESRRRLEAPRVHLPVAVVIAAFVALGFATPAERQELEQRWANTAARLRLDAFGELSPAVLRALLGQEQAPEHDRGPGPRAPLPAPRAAA